MSKWTIFSNHGHVLIYLARDSDARLRDVAQSVGITERAVQKIVRDLQDGGIISVTKHGRRNRYRIHTRKSLRHELASHRTVGNLIKMLKEPDKPKSSKPVIAPVAQEAAQEAAQEVAREVEPVVETVIEPIPEFADAPWEDEAPPFDPDSVPWDEEVPEPQAEAEPKPEPEPEPEPKKKESKDDQQGSLF